MLTLEAISDIELEKYQYKTLDEGIYAKQHTEIPIITWHAPKDTGITSSSHTMRQPEPWDDKLSIFIA